MVKIKSQAQIEANYRAGIPGAAAKYKNGIQATVGWKDAAIKGQGLYVQRMQDQNVLARREKGLNKVSDQAWQQAALNQGSARIATGMDANASKQSANFEPFRKVIESTSLPDRTADPASNVQNRVLPIVMALHNAKNSQ